MTPAEALEQIRALAEARNDEVRGNYRAGSRVAEEVIASGQALIPTSTVLAILDAVTPDAAVTVETVEQLEALPVWTGVLPVGGAIPAFRMSSGEPAGLDWCAPGSSLGYTAHEIRLPAIVLTPATPERFQRGTWHHIGRGGIEPHLANPDMDRVTTDRPSGKPGAPCLTCASGEAVLFTAIAAYEDSKEQA